MQNIELSSKRTDIALESHEINKQQKGEPILYDNTDQSGVEIEHGGNENIKITRVKITSDEGANAIGKPIGNYITLEIPGLRQYDQQLYEASCQELAKELVKLFKLDDKSTVLVIGLGNWNVTPDSLGPKAVSKLMVTRHLLEYI